LICVSKQKRQNNNRTLAVNQEREV